MPERFIMDYTAMETLAVSVNNLRSQIEEMDSSMESIVNSLDGQWMGKAQVEFAASYKKLKPEIKEIIDAMRDFAGDIHKAANITMQTDSNIKF